jgi:hypothetical protein
MVTPASSNGEILHLWLRLLGWQIETARDGDFTVGVGTRFQANGSAVRVASCARTEADLALQLFEQAMQTFESRHTFEETYEKALGELTAA